MSLDLSNRALKTPASPIRRLSHLSTKAVSEGKKVYHLNIGQPDIETPNEFFEGLNQYQSKIVSYETSEGNKNLRSSWTNYFNKSLNLNIEEEELLITTGASEALIFSFMIACDPGDEVLIFDPTYANYIGFAAISGVNLIPVTTELENNFALPDAKDIASKITDKTKAMLLCSPNNPTGTVYTEEEVRLLIDICNERDIFLIVDETYREFVFDNGKVFSVLHLEKNNPRIIVIDSLSKRFSLCGARIGCIITSNKEFLRNALNLAQARLASPSVEQIASAYMLNKISDSYLDTVIKTYESRRNVLYDSLSKIEGIELQKPKGAFYVVARLPVNNAEKFASFLLSDFHVDNETTFVAPASGFYMTKGMGHNKIRIAYVLKEEDLIKAVNIIEQGLKVYQD
ncbi:UNVERIFIED_CONTAM: hypothetical protein GTU68_041335 [Idotea baltica]|nr:hypothetical protein [Idotea baltica]